MKWRPWLLAAAIIALAGSATWILVESRGSQANARPTDSLPITEPYESTPRQESPATLGRRCETGAPQTLAPAPDSWAVEELLLDDERTHATVRHPRDWRVLGRRLSSGSPWRVSISFHSLYISESEPSLRWDHAIQVIEDDRYVVAEGAVPLGNNACLITGRDGDEGDHFAAVIRLRNGADALASIAEMDAATTPLERSDAIAVLPTFQPID
jgi:hypothetical protein